MQLDRWVAMAAVGTLALSACSGDDGAASADKAGEGIVGSGVITPSDLPDAPRLKRERGVIADTAIEECSTGPGVLEARGKVTNSAAAKRDLVVVVSWATSTSDVVARGVATMKDVRPGETSSWSVRAESDLDGLTCVPSAVAGRLA